LTLNLGPLAITALDRAALGSLTLPNLMNCLHIAGGCLWGGTVIVYAARILPRARPAAPKRRANGGQAVHPRRRRAGLGVGHRCL
jgi:hypothetical protein